jgi:hypothetical protein
LRRRLLVEPPVPKNGTNSSNLEMDNPLSQNPGKSLIFSPIYGKNKVDLKDEYFYQIAFSASCRYEKFKYICD